MPAVSHWASIPRHEGAAQLPEQVHCALVTYPYPAVRHSSGVWMILV